jgi:glucose-1-phosphate cytidylyltransferase
MVSVGEQPILWHVMKMYSQHGINEFVICLGYKGYVIKEFFSNYFLHTSDVTFDLADNSMEVHRNSAEPWKVTLVDTGATTMTGGRVRRIAPFVKDEEAFCLTYGDGVSDVDIKASLDFHRAHGKLCTVTGVRPPGRFGALTLQGDKVDRFEEKPVGDGSWINGGFFVMSPKVIDYIPEDDGSVWEQGPMRGLAADGQLQAYLHDGFWQCMDTVRDRAVLEELWASGKAPWKSW